MIDKVLLDLLLEHINNKYPYLMKNYASNFAQTKGYKPEVLWAVKCSKYSDRTKYKVLVYLGPQASDEINFKFAAINIQQDGRVSCYDIFRKPMNQGLDPNFFSSFLGTVNVNPDDVVWAA